jgi:hypothetical protein
VSCPAAPNWTQLWRGAGVGAIVVAASLTNHITEIRQPPEFNQTAIVKQ